MAPCTALGCCLASIHLGSEFEGAEALVAAGRLWVDVDKHQRLAVATQARLQVSGGTSEGVSDCVG